MEKPSKQKCDECDKVNPHVDCGCWDRNQAIDQMTTWFLEQIAELEEKKVTFFYGGSRLVSTLEGIKAEDVEVDYIKVSDLTTLIKKLKEKVR